MLFFFQMTLRKRNYPPILWLNLHKFTIDPWYLLPSVKHRHRKPVWIIGSLASSAPHVQRLICHGSIDKRQGEIRSGKYPSSPEQFSLIKRLSGSKRYASLTQIENSKDLEYEFLHKGDLSSSANVQFRIQKSKPTIHGKKPALFLSVQFQQETGTPMQIIILDDASVPVGGILYNYDSEMKLENKLTSIDKIWFCIEYS